MKFLYCLLIIVYYVKSKLPPNKITSEYILLPRGSDGVEVPWYQNGGTWYNTLQMWWNLVPKVKVPIPSLHESVPMIDNLSSMDVFGIPRTNFSV